MNPMTRTLPPIVRLALLTACVLGTAAAGRAADVKPLATGSPAPEFDLPGVDGKNHTLADYAGAKVLVVVFTCNHCPTAQAYEDRLIKLHEDYRDEGVALVAINPNDPLAVRLDELGYSDLGDSLAEMKLRAAERKFPFPYLNDGDTQSVSKAYGALATPHVFVFDADRKLRYQGRIDDSERDAAKVKHHDARNAIDALLAGRAPPAERTNVFGCSTKWADKRADAERSLAEWDKEEVSIDGIDAAAVKKLAANDADGAKLRLVNVWATWCGPCVTELPELVTINRMYRGRAFETVTISMDEPDQRAAALELLRKKHVATTNYHYAGDDKDALVAALDPEWQGPIPHTILIAPGGKVLFRKAGAFDPLELKRAIVNHLGRTY
jgi:peroxiredoxin